MDGRSNFNFIPEKTSGNLFLLSPDFNLTIWTAENQNNESFVVNTFEERMDYLTYVKVCGAYFFLVYWTAMWFVHLLGIYSAQYFLYVLLIFD